MMEKDESLKTEAKDEKTTAEYIQHWEKLPKRQRNRVLELLSSMSELYDDSTPQLENAWWIAFQILSDRSE